MLKKRTAAVHRYYTVATIQSLSCWSDVDAEMRSWGWIGMPLLCMSMRLLLERAVVGAVLSSCVNSLGTIEAVSTETMDDGIIKAALKAQQ